jgi:ABC-2 type transport system ATP-binding protein
MNWQDGGQYILGTRIYPGQPCSMKKSWRRPGSMQQNPVLQVEGLVKVFPGGVEALRGISFMVERGEIFGLLGPNGAGKTTTFRIIATLLRPTRGRVLVDGVDVAENPLEARKRLVYVPEEVGGYRRLTGLEYLRFVVGAYLSASGSDGKAKEVLREAVKLTGLPPEDLAKKKMGEYSKGMKRRVQVAWALAVKPRLAILDEPTSGLDVEASYELRRTIAEYAKKHGVTVLLSSHNMLEVQHLCDRVALMRRGRIIDTGTPRELIEKYDAVDLEDAYMKAVRAAEESEG